MSERPKNFYEYLGGRCLDDIQQYVWSLRNQLDEDGIEILEINDCLRLAKELEEKLLKITSKAFDLQAESKSSF